MVARVQWAFQVSQGSLDTWWGGKRLHHFAANLFRKQPTRFHRNCQSFMGYTTENICSLFFWTRCIYQNFHYFFWIKTKTDDWSLITHNYFFCTGQVKP